jgi:hypothetical protein
MIWWPRAVEWWIILSLSSGSKIFNQEIIDPIFLRKIAQFLLEGWLYILNAYNFLSVLAKMVYNFLASLLQEKSKFKVFACFFENICYF